MDGAPPPPPPPPHGASGYSKPSDLPKGQYDIFIVPPHSSGSGFLYLPSLQTNRNSFLAGVACTTVAFVVWSIVVPVASQWLKEQFKGGGPGVLMIMVAVGTGMWALGKTQGEAATTGTTPGTSPPPGPTPGPPPTAGPGTQAPGADPGADPGAGPAPGPPPNPAGAGATPPPKSSWQRPNPSTSGGTAPKAAGAGTARSNWERAREETKKRQEEQRRAEEVKKRREELEKKRQEQREKDAKERAEREKKEKEEKEKEERDKKAKEEEERKAKEEQERKAKEERERKAKEEASAAAAAAARREAQRKPPPPTARTEAEDDAYSFRPYDRPKRPYQAHSAASMYSESSYAPSATTARTTPPPSHRGPYSTNDPDKIIIKGVYSFNNAFMRTPIAQLITGQGNVTDGLILRITTEGLFIDDDVRGVPQREWDVKAWTMKLAEVLCPHFPFLSHAFRLYLCFSFRISRRTRHCL